MTLTALTPYGPSVPSTRVRVRQWLARTGIRAELIDYAGLPNHSVRTLAKNVGTVGRAEVQQRLLVRRHFDRLLIHKEVTPFSSGGLAEQLFARSSLGVYDFDDAVMWTEELSGNSRWSLSGVGRALWSKSRACERTVAAADRVIAGNDVLADWASQHNRNVQMIPSCVEPDDYPVKDSYEVPEHPRLVWLGSPATEPQLQVIAHAMIRLNALTGARLTVISAGARPLGGLDAVVDRVQWVPGIETTLAHYDLAVAPLFDAPYERGKSAYKIIQYGAAGLPTIGSPVAANAVVLRDLGQIPASNNSEWLDGAVDITRAPPQTRKELGATGRDAVERGYSYQAWQRTWLAAVGEGAHPLSY
jgi:hypothetical protein